MLLKPRFGKRRWSGIWPPSKPLMATPVRAFWPLTPRPAVLPLPEPMPRPTRMRAFREPARSAISLSFMSCSSGFVDDADEMGDLGDHPADRRRVGQCFAATNLVEAETDQRSALLGRTPDRAAGLLNDESLAFVFLGHGDRPLCLGRFGIAVAPPSLQRRDLDAA